mgnify:CR=1 FL=1
MEHFLVLRFGILSMNAVAMYSWQGNGNLGDDWIGQIGKIEFPDSYPVHEYRDPKRFAHQNYRLRKSRFSLRDIRDPIVLWGGGWLASDRGTNESINRWLQHLERTNVPVFGFGLGVGPFTLGDSSHDELLNRLQAPLYVRSTADLEYADKAAHLSGDVVFLDSRIPLLESQTTLHGLVGLSLPRYSPHWALTRPWITEKWYRDRVAAYIAAAPQGSKVLFIEFSAGSSFKDSDSYYWRELDALFVKPRNELEAAEFMRSCDSFLAGRLHAGFLAALSGIPTVGLAYHHKFLALAETGIPVEGIREEPTDLVKPLQADPRAVEKIRARTRLCLEQLKRALSEAV